MGHQGLQNSFSENNFIFLLWHLETKRLLQYDIYVIKPNHEENFVKDSQKSRICALPFNGTWEEQEVKVCVCTRDTSRGSRDTERTKATGVVTRESFAFWREG